MAGSDASRRAQLLVDHLLFDRGRKLFDWLYARRPGLRGWQGPLPGVIGHRGLTGHPDLRENTLEAFQRAVELGAGIELDVRRTADGEVLVHHDSHLERVHGVEGDIASLPAGEIRRRAPAVPRLADVLDRFGHACPWFFIEIKSVASHEAQRDLIESTAAAVRARNLGDKVVLIALSGDLLDLARDVAPDLARAYVFTLTPRRAVAYCSARGDTGLLGWYARYPLDLLPRLATGHLVAGAGFIDDRRTAEHLAALGFPFLFSNRPDLLLDGSPRSTGGAAHPGKAHRSTSS